MFKFREVVTALLVFVMSIACMMVSNWGLPLFLLLLLLITATQIVQALVNGVRILRQSRQEYGSNAMTLRLLALNLIEPAINSIVITGLVFYATDFSNGFFRPLEHGFLIAAPMMILLLPILHVRNNDAVCGDITIKLAMLGMLRWSVTALIIMNPFCVLLGFLVLGYSIYWVKRQPAKLVQHYAIGVGADGVMVGDLSDFSQANRPRIRL